jgi:site-specific DNA-methyltransferase (adenine-specific)
MITLINGEAISEMKKLKDNSIDFVLIDPPYKLDLNGGSSPDSSFANRKLVKDKHIEFICNGYEMDSVFDEIIRLQEIVNAVIFCSNAQISETMSYWEKKKYSTTLLVWTKINPIPLANKKYISDLEFMVYVRGKKSTFNKVEHSQKLKTFRYNTTSTKNRIHPTEKPQAILNRLINNHSNEGDLILDCFGGSFSTGLACLNLKRNFIGIEIDKDIFDKAEKRIKQHQAQQKLIL